MMRQSFLCKTFGLRSSRAFQSALLILSFIQCGATLALGQNSALDDARKDRSGDIYVSANGSDAGSGTQQQPFATLERARDAVRDLQKTKPITVVVRDGAYRLEKTFQLSDKDSGTEAGRIVWRAEHPGKAILSGGVTLDSWSKVKDEAILARIPESARGKVMQADLKAAGVTDFGSPKGGAVELFFNGKPMTVSRYPNEGFVKIVGLTGGNPIDVRGTKGDKHGDFQYEDERINRWTSEKDGWVHGYWFWDWAEERHPIESINPESKTLKVKPPFHSYGYRVNQWFYGYNLLCELDQPGEYYIDREAGVLYFYPPESIQSGTAVVSTVGNMIESRKAAYVTIQGFVLEYARGNGMSAQEAKQVLIAGCTLRNLAGGGIQVSGSDNTIFGCHLYGLGKSGLSANGGDRKTLTPGNNLISNNEVHDYARIQRVYAPGVSINGVGNKASHNKIYNAPHMGMGFGGNENVIEYNEIFNVCYESNDAGAIYTGRNWTMRGNVLQYNYLHDIRGFQERGCVGMYLDDQFSSARMFGNVFRNVSRATMIGGGRDNEIVNNIYINCSPCVHLDARGLGWQKAHTDSWVKELQEKGTNCGINITVPPYSDRYPELGTILENPGTPAGNCVARNLYIGGNWNGTKSGQWQGGSIWGKAAEFNTIEDNFEAQEADLEDLTNGNFTVKAGVPALKAGFQQIPWQKIGLFDDSLRAR